MAELFGRVDGCARGRGGSMHPADPEIGYLGGWGIVGGQLPLAVGAAFTLAQEECPQAVLCELGEGAVNIGAWHEALNLAAIWDSPVVVLVMNNEYSMGSPVAEVSAEPEAHKRAAAFSMRGERVDGQDVEVVHEAAHELLRDARELRRPAVLEALPYRYRATRSPIPGPPTGRPKRSTSMSGQRQDHAVTRPEGGPAMIRASARHLGGLAHAIELREHVVDVDEPADAGGDNLGPTPEELLTGALAACTAITLRMHGGRKGWDLDGLEVVAEAKPGERGACGPFEVTLRLPKELSEEQVRRLRVIASKCPVHRTLASPEACAIKDRVERI